LRSLPQLLVGKKSIPVCSTTLSANAVVLVTLVRSVRYRLNLSEVGASPVDAAYFIAAYALF
jgi:hypothetical protein